MKLINIRSLLVAGALVTVAVTGCKKEDFAVNTNPNDITASTVDYRTVLPSALANTATVVEGSNWKFLQNWMGWWARSGSFQDVTDEETYDFDNNFNVGIWNSTYANASNYHFVAQRAAEDGAGFYEAISRIMRSHNFQILVDVYGNVPYTQALQGGVGIITPTYDDALDIYKDLMRQLDTAIALLKDSEAISTDNNINIEQNDLVYGGDAQMWVKFANTLKLRMIMHAYQAPGFDVAGEAAIIEAEGSGFLEAGESAIMNPGYSATKPSPFYRAYVLTETGVATNFSTLEKANAYAVGPYPAFEPYGWYTWNGDPRVDRFYKKPTGSTTHNGIPYGELAGVNPNNEGAKLSTIDGPGLIPNGASSRSWILTSMESYFLQAEAKERGILPSLPSVEDLVRNGVYESFIFLGLTTADADDYFTANAGYSDTDVTGPAGALYTIMAQKWFSLNAIAPFEVWTDYRRTGIVYGVGGEFAPGPPISVNPVNTETDIPVRLFYPQNEYNYNAANVAAQGTIDVYTTRIFWDIN